MSEYWPVVIIILQLIFLEGILSIDNAAVIGALVSPLPDDERRKIALFTSLHNRTLAFHQRTLWPEGGDGQSA